MTCYHPLKAYRPLSNLDGGRLVFNSKYALNSHNPVTIPCGACIGCRIDRSRDWAMRCMHESQMHERNCFVTLTYSDENLPENFSVSVRTHQLFMKSLRNSINKPIRFFGCGEYGEQTLRPHYHYLIFDYHPTDTQFLKTTKQGNKLFTSKSLEKIWPHGHVWIGAVTYQSAAYVARYIMKKVTGDRAPDYYSRVHPITKKPVQVYPEFCVQSRRPGIGSTWYDKYKQDCFPSDYLVVDGKKHPVPKFYTKKLAEEELTKIKRRRKADSLPRKPDNTPVRLAVREEIKQSRLKTLKREL